MLKRKTVSTLLYLSLSLPTLHLVGPEAFGQEQDVDWRLLFNQMFAMEIRKDLPHSTDQKIQGETEEEFQRRLQKHTYFHPQDFNTIIPEVVNGASSSEVHDNLDRVLGQEKNRKKIAQRNFAQSIPFEVYDMPGVKSFVKKLDHLKKHTYKTQGDQNYFDTEEGKLVTSSLLGQAKGKYDGVAVVMVAGFASHTIKDGIFTYTIAEEANQWNGRNYTRPLYDQEIHKETGTFGEFLEPEKFYGSTTSLTNVRQHKFDVLHPMGDEMGNTAGSNEDNAKYLHTWLKNLPPEYANKKLIFVTYSKSAPMFFDFLRQAQTENPELLDRVLGMVSYAGVLQGTGMARVAVDEVTQLIGPENVAKLHQAVENPDKASEILGCMGDAISGANVIDVMSAIHPLGPAFRSIIPTLKSTLASFGVDPSVLEELLSRKLEAKDVAQVVVGVTDLTPKERAKKNLLLLNNSTVKNPMSFYNLSAVTNVKDFTMPRRLNKDGSREPALMVPQFKDDGKIDWKNFNLDALLLYLTSIPGQSLAPGGLYDTQVELGHTKSMLLDKRPFKDTLLPQEIDELWADPDPKMQQVFKDNGITRDMLANKPRNELIKPENRTNIEAVDFGEIRGNHWDAVFDMAIKPPPYISKEHAHWEFPRMAYMRALLQTIALHNVVKEEKAKQQALEKEMAKNKPKFFKRMEQKIKREVRKVKHKLKKHNLPH